MKEVSAIGIHFEKPPLSGLSLKRGALILAGSLVALACSSVSAPPLASETPGGDSSGACSDSEVIPVLGSDKTITRGEYLKTLEGLLRTRNPFVDRSFAEVMSDLGYTVGELQQNCPAFPFQAGPEGSYRRLRPVPPSSDTHNVLLSGLEVNWGWWYRSYGLLPVTNTKTGETTYFSLAEAWEPAEGITWPTFVREGDEYPHPFRRYTQPVYPFPTADSYKLYPKYIEDRAIDYGKGVVGSTPAQIERANSVK